MVPFCPLYFRAPLLKPNGRKKGTLVIKVFVFQGPLTKTEW